MCIPYKKDIMQESHTYYLLSKYMDHTISTEELKTLRLLVNLSDDDELSLSLSHLWENGRPFEEVDERIIRDMFSEIQNRTRKERFVMVFRKLARIAAILLIPLLSILSGYLYFNPVDQKGSIGNLVVHADRGERSGVTLPDGTQVKLNAESSLSYTHDFGRELRQVNLEGEAYFEVTRDEEPPFIVSVKNFDVRVLGTSFNVMSYDDEFASSVTLLSGKVETTSGHDTVRLSPGEQVSITSDNRMTVQKTDINVVVSWMDGKFGFSNERLDVIMRKICRWYDVEVLYAVPGIRERRFTGAPASNMPLKELLEALSTTTNLQFSLQDGVITIKQN